MADFIGLGLELVRCIGRPLCGELNELRKLSRNLNKLKEKRNMLVAKEHDVRGLLHELQERQGKLPVRVVLDWLQNVERVKSDVSTIEQLFEELMPHCFCSNCHKRFKLAKSVVEKIQEVEGLVAKQLRYPLAIDPPTPIGMMLNPPPIVGDSTSEQIKKLLNDPNVWKIGVYGMGGVGKTTIMKAINDELVAMEEFSQIIWVNASKENMGGIEGLQHRIAQHFGDYFRQQLSSLEDEVIRAAKLSEKLKRAGNFVLIIDDLWEKITLEQVGIPEFINGDQNKGKIVVTTRSLTVCDSIDTQVNVQVKCLPEEAAWELFVSKVGEWVLRSSNIEPLARQVLDECAGLPLAIVTVGGAMKRKQSSGEWSHALNVLRNSTGDDLDLHDKVFKSLKFSYDNLKEEAKSCFLYLAFYPEDHRIDSVVLVEHWIAEGYTSAGGSTSAYDQWDWEAEFNKGFYILGELEDACLLQIFKMKGVENADHVGMHDLVRDLAIQIMRKDLNFISKAGMDLSRKWPEEAFAKARKISMVDAHLEAFPNQPSCNPNLSTLLLGHSEIHYQKRVTIPMSFFSKMLALQVLDISYIVMDMKELPESLSELVGLRALFLVCLSLKKIPSLAKLKELQMLSFRNSTIDEAPAGMEALVNLRLLNLEETAGFKNFNPDLISKLSLLEQLNMLSCDILSKSSRIAASCIEGIASLKCLTNLSMSFDDMGNYLMALKLIQWNKLKGFYIHVWPNGWWTNPPTTCRGNYNKKFVSINAFSPTKFSDIQIPSNSQELWLQVVYRTLEDLEWKEDTTKDEVHLLPGNGLDPRTLASLENLTLKYFNFEFDVFCRESLQKDCLTSLKNLIIDGFWLKNLSSFNTLQQLKNLEVFKVLSCVLMEEIIKEEVPSDGSTEVTSEIVLPKLHTLIFGLLPKLHCISSNMTWICDSLKVVAVFDCPELEQFPLIQFPTLGIIYGTSEWWEGLQWENPTTKDILQSHFRVANATDAELCSLLGSNYSC